MRIMLSDTTEYWPSSPMFAEALAELAAERGYQWLFFDEASYLPAARPDLFGRVRGRLLRPAAAAAMNFGLLAQARRFQPDILLILKGRYYWPSTLQRIKRETGAILINFSTDDPFNRRVNSRHLVKSISAYDLYASPRRSAMDDIRRAGARRVEYVRFGYKPSLHYPEGPATEAEKNRFCCDVMFIGGADPERAGFFESLIPMLHSKVPAASVALYGGYWQRYPQLRTYARGVAMGREYRLAISGAKITVNLVRRANRDGHVMRTFEVPACGGFMLAERTPEHEEIFPSGCGVDLFESVEELVAKIAYYLARDDERGRLAQLARATVLNGGHTYKDRLRELLELVTA